MSLRITKSSEPIIVERLNIALYGQPGSGKSSLAFTARTPLLLDFDAGAHRAANRKDTVRVQTWEDVADMTAPDLSPYSTIIVDTAGRALDVLSADIIRRNPKAGRGGALTLQGFGTLKAEFIAWLKALNQFGKDVVLIAHMDEQRNGDDIIERLDVQGGSKGEIYKAADAMGRLSIKDGKRILNFNPTETAFGKNPGQLRPLIFPHPDSDPTFLGDVIDSIKAKLNQLTAEQSAAASQMLHWHQKVGKLDTVADFNEELEAIKKQPKAIQVLFSNAAKTHGYEFDKNIAKFKPAPAQAKPAPANAELEAA